MFLVAKIIKNDKKSLKSFQSDYEPAKLYLIYNGEQTEYHEDITVLPIEKALKLLPDLLQNKDVL